jgi:hypothetical protein
MRCRAAGLGCAILLATTPAFAQSPTPDRERIEPDRPDVTNSAHLVPTGQLQIEFGGAYTRTSPEVTGFGSPVLARIGVSDRIEARIGADGWVGRTESNNRQMGFGNVQAAAKLRVLSDSSGKPIVSVMPAINLPSGSASKGLGSGDVDYTLTVLTGVDVGSRGHVDANYGVGQIGTGGGRPHFTQHLVSVSASVSVAERWDPYAEVFWFSAQEPGGGAIAAMDVGAICHVRNRLALDGGLQVGFSHAAPGLAVFAGISVGLRHSEQ